MKRRFAHNISVNNAIRLASIWLILSVLQVACYTVPKQDPELLRQTKELRGESLGLMSQATAPFQNHRTEVDALLSKLKAVQDRAMTRGGRVSIRQWELLLDPNQDSFGGFIKLWEIQSTLTETYIEGKIKYIGDNFDQIIRLEEGLPQK
jgi:hypothetical protein